MPLVSTIKLTANQFLELGEDPPGVRLELVDGEVAVSPSLQPEHSYTLLTFGRILGNHIEEFESRRVAYGCRYHFRRARRSSP